jgi:hypothetical protein
MADAKNYEVLAPVDFGYKLDPTTRAPKDEQPDYAGYYEPASEGSDPVTVSLPDNLAKPLLASGSIKPQGEDAPSNLPSKNPEEDGYLGEEVRNQAMQNDEVYTNSGSAGVEKSGSTRGGGRKGKSAAQSDG